MRKISLFMTAAALAGILLFVVQRGVGQQPDTHTVKLRDGGWLTRVSETKDAPGRPKLNTGAHSHIVTTDNSAAAPGELIASGSFNLRSVQQETKSIHLHVAVTSSEGDVLVEEDFEPFEVKGGPDGTPAGTSIPFYKVYSPLPAGSYTLAVTAVDHKIGFFRMVSAGEPDRFFGYSSESRRVTVR